MYSNRIPAAVIASANVVVLVHREPPSPNQRVNCPSGETYSQCHFSGTVVAVGSVPAFASAALRPEPDADPRHAVRPDRDAVAFGGCGLLDVVENPGDGLGLRHVEVFVCAQLRFAALPVVVVQFAQRPLGGARLQEYHKAAVPEDIPRHGFLHVLDVLEEMRVQVPGPGQVHDDRLGCDGRALHHRDRGLGLPRRQAQRHAAQRLAPGRRVVVLCPHRYRRLPAAASGGGDVEPAARRGERPRFGRRHRECRLRTRRAAQYHFVLRRGQPCAFLCFFAPGEQRHCQQQPQRAPDYL